MDTPIPPPITARNQYTVLFRKKGVSPSDIAAAAQTLTTSNAYAALNKILSDTPAGVRLNDAQVAALCGVILAHAGVDYDTLQRVLEPVIRDAVVRAQQ